jgi:hypothetical protein
MDKEIPMKKRMERVEEVLKGVREHNQSPQKLFFTNCIFIWSKKLPPSLKYMFGS